MRVVTQDPFTVRRRVEDRGPPPETHGRQSLGRGRSSGTEDCLRSEKISDNRSGRRKDKKKKGRELVHAVRTDVSGYFRSKYRVIFGRK